MGVYADLSLAVLDNVPSETFREDEGLNRMLSQTYQYIAVSRIYTASPGALDHFKIITDLISAMALMRDPGKEEEAVSDWTRSYEAFGGIPGSTLIEQEWPAVHLALIYALRKDPADWQKGEDILLPVLKAREQKFGKDSNLSIVSGKVLHVLGDLRRSQGNLNEALDLFQRALGIFRATIGNNHYITADSCYRFAEQLIRTGKKDEANRLLEPSLKIYGDTPWYKPQASRSAFMKGKLLKSMGNDVEGDAQLQRAMTLRKEIVPDDHRS
ncbi:uncharacterized protein BDZ99DRAFT_527506 [Mytilinidion resinicola]|uniref:TPR-like protein n=1 Tax=Mytilinidion resinicola TaxID=574789 RepID=A0A6A6Y1G1_9PEZI|nr:uncharacterized protein BDZ99DRAFT_527506 [Mytilinidion resinicola]KAF2802479.1 hypothetical protein BDZ99DRAFT_527506 [Mytilinidion resinicola]